MHTHVVLISPREQRRAVKVNLPDILGKIWLA